MPPNLSVFANVSPTSFKGNFTVDDVLKTIRSEKFKTPTVHLRSLTDAEAAKIYKAGKQNEQGRLVEPGHFYGVTWSGEFEGGKKVDNLQAHSGMICMDVDGLTTDQTTTLYAQLSADEYTHILFVSPSGNGIKWVVKIDLHKPDEHKAFFRQLSDYLHDSYGLTRKSDVAKSEKPQIDPSGSDVSRLCFLPYAPDAYHNPDSEQMPLLAEYEPTATPPPTAQQPPRPPVNEQPPQDDTHQRLNACITELQRSGIDLTATYDDWVKIGLAFASLGEEGRSHYHAVSGIHAKYSYTATDAKFSELLRNRSGQVNIGTFFHRCEQVIGSLPKPDYNRNAEERTDYGQNRFDPPPADTPPPVDREWPKPQPIVSQLLPVMTIAPDMIPEPLRPWLTDVAYRMKCPLDFVASAAVVMLSSLIGTRLTIQPKVRDDWTIVPNLWGAVIGGPSAMKTPSVSEVMKPLRRLVFAAHEQYCTEITGYERAVVDYDVQKKAYAAQGQNRHKGKKADAPPVDFPTAPTKPKERRYMVSDSTVEKLADLLNDNPTGLLQLRDELIGLLAGWDRSGREEDRAFYLEAWNGNNSRMVDRIGRGSTHVETVCVSLFGSIQPAKLLPYLQAATGYENDGFVQRLQVAVYPDAAPWEYTDDYPDKSARDRAFTLIQTIADSTFDAIGYEPDDINKFPYTRFSTDAQAIFKQWLIEWETTVLPNESGLLLEHFTKYRSLMPSLALIFHVVNCIEDPGPLPANTEKHFVSTDAAQMAVRWCAYLMSHARRIYGLLDTANIEAAKELIRHLKADDLKDGFKLRDIYRKQWTYLKTPEQAEAAVNELVTRHYLAEVEPPTKAGRPEAPHYLINPKIHPKA